MTLSNVRSRLVSICTGTVPVAALGLPSSFTHEPSAGDLVPLTAARGFFIAVDSMAVQGPQVRDGGGNRRIDNLRIAVRYPVNANIASLEDAIADDYDALSRRVLDSALWVTDTSTIVSISGPVSRPPWREALRREDEDVIAKSLILRSASVTMLTVNLLVEHTR
jgi:hypothetical protein